MFGRFRPPGIWKPVSGITVTSGNAECWETAPDGNSTLRIYQAPTGAIVNTGLICGQEFKDDGIWDPG